MAGATGVAALQPAVAAASFLNTVLTIVLTQREISMMVKCPAESKLTDTLQSLEQSLLSPLVGGDIEPWVKNVEQRAATLSVDIATFSRTVLHVQYAEIARNAPELSKQLDALIAADNQLLQQSTDFLTHLHQFAEIIEQADPQKRETKLEPHRQKVVELGLAIILTVRKQQAAANTWFEESQFRDIGNAAD